MEESNKLITVNFNNETYNVPLISDQKIDIDLNECLNLLNSYELFDYLYSYHIEMFEDINSDIYFNGKTIKSGIDLINSITEITQIAYYNKVIYICGEYWCDPEHGFSIKFPNGKFIKSKYNSYDYNRDEGKDVKYKPICTLLGQSSDYCN